MKSRPTRSLSCYTIDGKVFCPNCRRFLFRIETLSNPKDGFGILIDLNCSKCHAVQEVMLIHADNKARQLEILKEVKRAGNAYDVKMSVQRKSS